MIREKFNHNLPDIEIHSEVMSTPKNILIAGAGIAGPTLALLLSRAGHKCTIVERAPKFRLTGQQVDVADNGLKVAQIMGIENDIRARTVHDSGMRFIDQNGKQIAEFPVGSTAGPAQWYVSWKPQAFNFDVTYANLHCVRMTGSKRLRY